MAEDTQQYDEKNKLGWIAVKRTLAFVAGFVEVSNQRQYKCYWPRQYLMTCLTAMVVRHLIKKRVQSGS